VSAPAPPRLTWPAWLQTLASLASVERFPTYVNHRHGDVAAMRFLFLGDLVAVADPDAIREIFTSQRDVLAAGEANRRIIGSALGASSVLTLDGDPHLRMRRLLLPAFHGDAVRGYERLVEEIAAEEIARWPRGKAFALHGRLQAITLEVMLRAVIGVRDPGRRKALRRSLPTMLRVNPFMIVADSVRPGIAESRLGRRFPWVRALRRAEREIYAEIAAHRADPEGREDILAMLMAARGEDGEALTDVELRDQVLTLLTAGHETTATALAWAFERLVRHPAALARLQEEIRAGEGDEYLGAVIAETLRSRPPIDTAWRRLTEDAVIGGYEVRAGTLVAPAISAIQHDARLWPEAEEFRPERFLGDGPDAPRSANIPFGGGPRRCIGAAFATMEMKTVLRAVLSSVDLAAASTRPERRDRLRTFTIVPSRRARVVAQAVS
jgi:cytochrome P450